MGAGAQPGAGGKESCLKPSEKAGNGEYTLTAQGSYPLQPNANIRQAGLLSRSETRVKHSGTLSPRMPQQRGWGSGGSEKGGQNAVLRRHCAEGWVYLQITRPPEVTWQKATLG